MPEVIPAANAADNTRLSTPRRRSFISRVLPVLLLTAYIAQCAWFIRTQSLTYDEPVDIAGGLDAWRNQRFELWNDHTPLARLICTLPIAVPTVVALQRAQPATVIVPVTAPPGVSESI